jgi:hypothetical protein
LPLNAWLFMTRKRGLNLRLILGTLCVFIASTAVADIYQWYDGDGDGSLWLSSSIAEPYIDLSNQVLWWADLQNANLANANLSHSNLFNSNFINADLEQSDLAFTNFYGANLQSVNMDNANVFYADFSNANLTEIENWDSAFWLAAKYTEATLFPDGMNPTTFGMTLVEVPAPGILSAFGIGFALHRRRR